LPGFELVGQEELAEITDIFDRANGVQFRLGFDQLRNGIFKVELFEKKFAERMRCKHALAVTSGTAALKVALKSIGIGKGDEVITQAFTFVATVEAIIECGATPVIAQIDNSLTLDPSSFESLITKKTKAVIPVHMLGVPCDMNSINEISKANSIVVIEDTAWGCGGSLNGYPLGTIGDIGCFSFDYAKAMTTGEGGMIVTNNADIDFSARAYHDHGHENNSTLKRWEDSRHGSGFNYRMTEMQGAFGLAQLRKLDQIIQRQRSLKSNLENALVRTFGNKIGLRPVIKGSVETADAIVFSVKDRKTALSCRSALLDAGLGTKILPEAISWHFAGSWQHIPELLVRHPNLKDHCAPSEEILARYVALPVSLFPPEDFSEKVCRALSHALNGQMNSTEI
jgi:8-amino-3,8-dideoxy-alpha-D-manno-octulosonate transaminase